jgi:hypothetical protein
MGSVHDFTAGEVLTASLVESWLQPLGKTKDANETVNNSTTLQNDNELFVTLATTAVYAVEMYLFIDSSTTADFKFDFTGPAGMDLDGQVTTLWSTTTDIREYAVPTAPALPNNTSNQLTMTGRLYTTGTAGTLQLRWAQNTATVVDTIVYARSYLRLTRLG